MKIPTFTEFINENEVLNESLSGYLSAIKNHDWYYMMSDDDRSTDRAQEEIKKSKTFNE